MQNRGFRGNFYESENAKRRHSDNTTAISGRSYTTDIFIVETNVRPLGWTAEGRLEQTDKQPNNPSGIRTLVGSDIG